MKSHSHSMKVARRRLAVLAAAGYATTLLSPPARAATWTWTGAAGNDHWFNTPNWNPSTTPANDGTANIIFDGSVRLTPDMNANWSVNSVTFGNSAGAFTLGSSTASTLTIGAGGIADNSNAEIISHAIALGAAQTWNMNSGLMLVSGPVNNGGNLLTVATANVALASNISGVISGSGGFTKSGLGILAFAGGSVNTFTGPVNVNDGTLWLSKPAAAISSTLLNIGDGIGALQSAILLNSTSNLPVGTYAAVSIKEDGFFDGSADTTTDNFASLTMRGGTVKSGFETDVHGDITTLASSSKAMITDGFFLLLAGGTHTFNVAKGTTPTGIDLDFSARLESDGGIIKAGPGTMRLSTSSGTIFPGDFTINAGTVLIADNFPLGLGSLIINNGAIQADGFLRTLSNPVIFAGTSTVGGTIDLTLTGGFAGSGSLIKNGSSTLTLNGPSSFIGPVTINAGTLVMYFTSLTGNVTNQASFVYSGGNFAGRLINAGAVTLNVDFIAGNGIENDAAFSIPAGRTVTTNGNGLDNEGILTMAGGVLVLSTTHSNINNGIFTLNAATALMLNGATLLNAGAFNLGGSFVGGPGTLTNNAGGTVTGQGIIACTFTNNGGAIVVQDATTTRITQPFSNTGMIQLSGTANLTGGAITNTGTIQGQGNIANAIINSATIDPTGGTLALAGALTNNAAGLLAASPGNKILVTGAFPTNAGLIALSGGTFDTNNQTLANSGSIAGFGILRTGGLTNNSLIEFASGNGQVFGAVSSGVGSKITVTQGSVATFFGSVTLNNTTFQVAPGATAIFFGAVSGNSNLNGGGIIDFESSHSPLANGLFNQANIQVQSPATLDVAALQANSLYLAGSVNITPNGTNAGLSILNSLTNAGGKLDLSNNDLIIHNATLAAIRPLLQSAYANGAWTGQGITTSSAPANPGQSLGLLTGIQYLLLHPTMPFDMQAIASTDILIKYTYAGDATLDGQITVADYTQLDAAFLLGLPGAKDWFNGDFNYDGVIDYKDYALIDFAYVHQSGGALAQEMITEHAAEFGQPYLNAFAAVPEPGSLGLAAAGLVAVLKRRGSSKGR